MLGKTYDPSVFSYIADRRIRNILETLVIETAEDLNQIEKSLLSHNIQVLRPSDTTFKVGKKILPSMLTPRDHLAMIGDTFYMPTPSLNTKWNTLKGESWPTNPPNSTDELDEYVKQELNLFGVSCIEDLFDYDFSCFTALENAMARQRIVYDQKVDSAMYRLFNGKIYVGTWPGDNVDDVQRKANALFPNYDCIVIPSEGHLDGVMFIACEGLIFSSRDIDVSIYHKVFPGWQIVYNNPSVSTNNSNYKSLNNGKWILKDAEYDNEFCDFIEHYFSTWTGDISESTFDVNMLFLDENNVGCVTVNESNFKILEQHGITPHVFPFRHINFWDSGLHCLTADIDRGN
jgi:hypothetical protein